MLAFLAAFSWQLLAQVAQNRTRHLQELLQTSLAPLTYYHCSLCASVPCSKQSALSAYRAVYGKTLVISSWPGAGSWFPTGSSTSPAGSPPCRMEIPVPTLWADAQVGKMLRLELTCCLAQEM